MKVPFVDLPSIYSNRKQEILESIESIIDSGSFTYSKHINEFEEKLAKYLGVKDAVFVSSGTAALEIAFKSLGIKPYDKVFVPANSFIATALAVSSAGGIPIFLDVDQDSWVLNKQIVEEAIDKYGKPFAVAPVHLYGLAIPDIKGIADLCHSQGIHVVEDCAQALGASVSTLDGLKKVGSFGDVGCCSFFPTKTLGAFGNAGALVTNKDYITVQARKIRAYGESAKYHSEFLGTNANGDSIQAAILSILLEDLNKNNIGRLNAVLKYVKSLANYPKLLSDLNFQRYESTNSYGHVYHLLVVSLLESEKRDSLVKELREKDIGAMVHYPIPIHKQRCYADCNNQFLPTVEKLSESIITLPCYPAISKEQVEYVLDTLEKLI